MSEFRETEPGFFVGSGRVRLAQWPDSPIDDLDEELWVVIDQTTGQHIACRRSAEAARGICNFLYEDQVATTRVEKLPFRQIEIDYGWNPWKA